MGLELVHTAKGICELALLQQEPPSVPQQPRGILQCCVPGRHRVLLSWSQPVLKELAPVDRYVVAAEDTKYGRAVTLAVLKPDYSERLGRFVPLEELRSHEVVEEELGSLA